MTLESSVTVQDRISGYLDWYFGRHPVHADALGVPGHAHRLGDFSAAAFEATQREADQWLERLVATPTTGDGGDQGGDGSGDGVQSAIDRDLVIATLRGRAVLDEWPAWRRDPATYLGPVLSGLLLPLLHRLRPEPQLVDGVIARLAEVPAVLRACQDNLDPALAAPLLVHRALGQAAAAPAFLRESLPAEFEDPALRARVAEAAAPAVEAFENLGAFLTGFADRATGSWQMGEARYSALLRRQELLGYGAEELHQRGVRAWEGLDAQLRELAPRVPGGSSDWRATMEGLLDDHPPTLEAMRAEYEAETGRARAFLAEHGLVSFADGERCRVVPAPAFQRPILAVASYVQPPGLAASRTGHFFVPFTPDGADDEAIRQRLRSNARAQLPTISVHEAYPGHHWHLSWSADRAPAVRTVHRSTYFVEGWALYAEGMMREQGYFTDPAHELAHLEFRAFRAARIVVDTALHCGDMDPAEARRFMSTRSSLSPDTATSEVDRYCAWPTQAPSYLTGCLEIEELRANWGGGLREFHDALAGSGCLPLGLAGRALAAAPASGS